MTRSFFQGLGSIRDLLTGQQGGQTHPNENSCETIHNYSQLVCGETKMALCAKMTTYEQQ